MNKVLILGGKPIGSCELVELVHEHGDYAIVTDFLPAEESPAKLRADECWDISTADIDTLAAKCAESHVDAVLTGIHEFNMARQVELCDRLNLPCYCNGDSLEFCSDKNRFKDSCREHGLPVARSYSVMEALDLDESSYPLAVKPLDGNGSSGFSKVERPEDLSEAIQRAIEFSESGQCLIEEYVTGDAVIIHYSALGGDLVYSGMADKASRKMGPEGSPIMALQVAPSIHEAAYLEKYDADMRAMLSSSGLKDGPIWIEAFVSDGDFVFNEIGFRFGGSMTPYLVEELSGIDQLDLVYAISTADDEYSLQQREHSHVGCYGIWPIHLKPGTIRSIHGEDEAMLDKRLTHMVHVHGVADKIEDWGSARQVFAYLHFNAENVDDLLDAMRHVKNTISVEGAEGEELLCMLFDPDEPRGDWPSFLGKS